MNYKFCLLIFVALQCLCACTDRYDTFNSNQSVSTIMFGAEINQQNVSRASDSGFTNGDCMGVYVVDYNGDTPGVLTPLGNRATNFALVYNQSTGNWTGNTAIYWKDNVTPVDVFGYYPFISGITEVDNFPFTVAADQSLVSDEEMSAYEKSDFLWSKAEKVTPTSEKIVLSYNHKMAGIKVILTKGEGFDDGEWISVPRLVTVDNVVRGALINLATGIITPSGVFDNPIVMLPQSEDSYRAVVVPQTVSADKSVISITIDGVSYKLKRSSEMVYTSGKMHTFTIKVDKRIESGDYNISLVSESISPWENDEVSHNFSMSAYVTVDVPVAGTLAECISEKEINVDMLQNLKITGEINTTDFEYIRNNIPLLYALNLREVKVKHARINGWTNPEEFVDNALPADALNNCKSIRTLILPEGITRLGSGSLSGTELTNYLVIPNSVVRIDDSALSYMPGINLEVVLPDSLEYIGNYAFSHSQFKCELKLSNTLKYIGDGAFENAGEFYGTFRLPDILEYLGLSAFNGMGNELIGDIVIPQNITIIPNHCFNKMGFAKGANVVLHDGITNIGVSAFANLNINTPLNFPASLKVISDEAFLHARLKGNLELPQNLGVLGRQAFGTYNYQTEITGLVGELSVPKNISVLFREVFYGQSFSSVVIPDYVTIINERALGNMRSVKTVSLGKNVDFIGPEVFTGCEALQTLVCLNATPPEVKSNTFSGLPLDKVILEVPEQSVELYRKTPVWNQFLNITEHKELAFNLPYLECLNKGAEVKGVVRSESEWEVVSVPSWCEISPIQGGLYGKEEVTIKINELAKGSGNREDKIVFKLKENDYSTYTTVRQYDYEHAEDTEIVLQEASADAKSVPLYIIGEGFTASSIVDGTYINKMREQMEHFFNVEPYKTYRNYFRVSTSVALSLNSGLLTTSNSNVSNRFGTYIDYYGIHLDESKIQNYVSGFSGLSNPLENATVLVLGNYESFMGTTLAPNWSSCRISFCGLSPDTYPYDQRGLIQHEVGGKNFASLGEEGVGHFDFIQACSYPCCNAVSDLRNKLSQGQCGNLSLTGNINSVPWKHLIFDSRYSDIVDVYEGGFNHLRGVFRSEPKSCMGAYIPYFNTFSREIIVRRIMKISGKEFDFEDFVAHDSRDGMPESE